MKEQLAHSHKGRSSPPVVLMNGRRRILSDTVILQSDTRKNRKQTQIESRALTDYRGGEGESGARSSFPALTAQRDFSSPGSSVKGHQSNPASWNWLVSRELILTKKQAGSCLLWLLPPLHSLQVGMNQVLLSSSRMPLCKTERVQLRTLLQQPISSFRVKSPTARKTNKQKNPNTPSTHTQPKPRRDGEAARVEEKLIYLWACSEAEGKAWNREEDDRREIRWIWLVWE